MNSKGSVLTLSPSTHQGWARFPPRTYFITSQGPLSEVRPIIQRYDPTKLRRRLFTACSRRFLNLCARRKKEEKKNEFQIGVRIGRDYLCASEVA